MAMSEGLQGKRQVDNRVGTIVWVQRKNGSWWPGRVVGPNELSPFHLLEPRAGTPVKLLGRDNASVGWLNLEKSKCVKAFRCGEFDDCIERAESSQAKPSQKIVKYACRQDAIIHALGLEKQELQKKNEESVIGASCTGLALYRVRKWFQFLNLQPVGYNVSKSTSGKWGAATVCRAKRSRCVYLPTESKNSLEHTVSYSKRLQVSAPPFGMGNCSFQSGSAEENIFSSSRDSDSSEGDSLNPGRYERVIQLPGDAILTAAEPRNSGNYGVQSGKMNCKEHGELSYLSAFPANDHNLPKRTGEVIDRSDVRFKHEAHNILANAACRNHSGIELDTKSGENLVWGANTPSKSALQDSYLEDLGSQSFDPAYTGSHSQMETTLVDVDVTTQASYGGKHVPLVSLKSKLNGKAIVGHRIEIEASVNGSSDIPLPRKDDIANKLFANYGSTMLQPVWRTSRRTSVCYVSNPQTSSTFEGEKLAQACQNSDHLKARTNSANPAQDYRMKPLNNQKTRTFSTITAEQKPNGNGGDLQPARLSCMIDGQDVQLKSKETMANGLTCIPLNLIFSKLLIAVGGRNLEQQQF